MYNHPKAKTIKNIEIEVVLPEEKPAIGKVAPIGVVIKPQDNMFLQYAFFELINERTDKRAPMDRVTSRSRYFFRYNVDKAFDIESENKYDFPLRIPVHKEPSRNDKFICIKWQLALKVIMTKTEDDAEYYCAESTPIEIEVV